MSMVKSAFDEERFFDESEGKNAFLFDMPSFLGFNSPKVKLDADMSVATESPEKETNEDIESLDNRDKADPRRCLERLDCMGNASWLDTFISSMLFKPPNESVDSDSFSSDRLEEFLLLRSNNEEVKELRPLRVFPNGLFMLLPGEASLPWVSLFQTKFSLLIRRILLEFLLAYELMSTELWIVDLKPMGFECPELLFDELFGEGRRELIEPKEVKAREGVEAFEEDMEEDIEEGIGCSPFRIVLGVEVFLRH